MRDTHMSISACESEAVTFGAVLNRVLLNIGRPQTEFVSESPTSDCDVCCPIEVV